MCLVLWNTSKPLSAARRGGVLLNPALAVLPGPMPKDIVDRGRGGAATRYRVVAGPPDIGPRGRCESPSRTSTSSGRSPKTSATVWARTPRLPVPMS